MRFFTILAALSLGAAPAHAELAPLGDDGFIVRHSATVAGTPEQVWLILVKPSAWWDPAHTFSGESANLTIEPSAGGCFCEMLPVGEGRDFPGSVRHMEVVLADPGRMLRMSGALGPLQSDPVVAVLTVTLERVENGTRLLAEYSVGGRMRFGPEDIGPAVDRVIGQQIAGLAGRIGVIAPSPEAIALPPSTAARDDGGRGEPGVEDRPNERPSDRDSFGSDFLESVTAGRPSDVD